MTDSRTPFPIVFLSAIGLLLSGCTFGPTRQQLFAPLIGAPEADLVARMGVPNRTYETGGVKFLAYDDRHVEVVPGMAPYAGWGPYYYGYGAGFPPEIVVRGCETTFEIVRDRVASFSLRGNDCG